MYQLPGDRLIFGAEVEHRWRPTLTTTEEGRYPWTKIINYEGWTTIRNAINRELKRAPYHDGFIFIVDPHRLTNQEFFKADGIHLTST